MNVNNRMVIQRMPWHSTMTEMNHLGRALLAKPEVFADKMMKIFSSYRYSDNPLTSMLGGTGREMVINSSEWEWKLQGASTRPGVIVENVLPTANTTPGYGNVPFKIKLDFDWYRPGDVIHPGTMDKKYQCRIQKGPIPQGGGFIYEVQLVDADVDDFLPVQYLAPNTKWGKLFAQYEEGSVESGSTHYALPQHLHSRLSRYRKKYDVTGDVARQVLAVKIPDEKGNFHNAWIKYAEAEYWAQWYREIERGLWYSRESNTVAGSTGRPILSGPGVQQLLEEGPNNYEYTDFTADLLEQFLLDIYYSTVSPGSQRNIKVFTGEIGMIEFHKAVMDKASTSGFLQVVDDINIQKQSTPYHSNGLSYGAQFVKYKGANGIEVEVVHNPIYDDTEINFDIDPRTGFPYESRRFTFLDFSGEGMESNIKYVRKADSMKVAYVPGIQSPYGFGDQKFAAHEGDFYTMTCHDQCGAHITDTSRCGELKPRKVG